MNQGVHGMPKRRRQRGGIRRTVGNTLRRLGMHAKASVVVEELAKYGIHVSEALVTRVKLDLLKDPADAWKVKSRIQGRIRGNRRPQFQKIPQKRPWRR
jgi:hypothetical protein